MTLEDILGAASLNIVNEGDNVSSYGVHLMYASEQIYCSSMQV